MLEPTNYWLVVFYVPSTARSFRDRAPFTVPCEGCKARFLHHSHRESNPGPMRGSPLHYHCATPALLNLLLNRLYSV